MAKVHPVSSLGCLYHRERRVAATAVVQLVYVEQGWP